jgi:starvation-inducible outer membrane lipoprotein
MTMMLKSVLLIFALALTAGLGLPQAVKKSKETNNMKTVRVHIDGFQKSKSGAI